MTTFLFLRITRDLCALRCRAVTRGEPRIRPPAPTSVPVPPACAGLPDRDSEATAPSQLIPRRFHAASRVEVGETCTGLWTERRTCPRSVKALVRRLRAECVRLAHADYVPLLILPEGTCCRRCDRLCGNEPRYRRFGPTKTHAAPSAREGCRHPVDRGAFHRCDRGHVKGLLLPFPATASRSRHPHVAPMAGDNVLFGHCKRAACRGRDEPARDMQHVSLLALRLRESRSPLQPRRGRVVRLILSNPRLGLTTQARQRGSAREALRGS
jgi:hypothetical protein